jgi:hypothetical protein
VKRPLLELDKNGQIKVTEKLVRKWIRDYLRQVPNCVFWHNLQGLGCYEGLPDYEGIYHGKHFYIEAKSPRGSQRPGQVKFQQLVESQGELYIIADNVEIVMTKLPIKLVSEK